VLRAARSHLCAAAISLQIDSPSPAPSFSRIGPRQNRVNSFALSTALGIPEAATISRGAFRS
jgi:hypothetical protein